MIPAKSVASVLFLLVLAGVACGSVADTAPGSRGQEPTRSQSALVFPVQPPRNSVMEALWEGIVTRDEDCLRLDGVTAQNPATPVWPPGFTYEERGSEVVVFDDTGAEITRTGERFKMGGGVVGEAGAPIPRELRERVKGCPAPYWIVGEIESRPR